MEQEAYCLFETVLGWCAIVWRERGDTNAVTLLHLPEATRELTEARIARGSGARQPTPPPPEVAEIIDRVRKHLQGEVGDFRDITLDLDGIDPLTRRVYEVAREIPVGETRTYGELARVLDQPGAVRAVGQALARNPIALIIPCHRVVAAGGRPGGFSAYGGRATKARLLAIEGAALRGSPEQRSLPLA